MVCYTWYDHGGNIKQGKEPGGKEGSVTQMGQERSKVVPFESRCKVTSVSYLEITYFSIKCITPFKLLWWLCNTLLYSKYKDKLRPNESTDLKKLKSPSSWSFMVSLPSSLLPQVQTIKSPFIHLLLSPVLHNCKNDDFSKQKVVS